MKIPNLISNWMVESLNSFISELLLSKSTPTIEAYRYDVAKFLEYLANRKVRRVSSLRPVHIIDYLGDCKERGKSNASISRYYMAIRAYCKFLRRTKVIQIDLTEDIAAPRIIHKAPRIPNVHEIDKILTRPNLETETGTRDYAILALLYSSGLRASELCDLELEDFKKEGSIIVRCGKRSKTRTIPVTEEATNAINMYIEKYRGTESGYLFLTPMGRKFRRQLLCKTVSKYAKRCNVEGVTTHTLRHACATHLLDEGADLRLIQEVLGHSSIASTQRYTHLSSSKMQQMFKQFHPRKVKIEGEKV